MVLFPEDFGDLDPDPLRLSRCDTMVSNPFPAPLLSALGRDKKCIDGVEDGGESTRLPKEPGKLDHVREVDKTCAVNAFAHNCSAGARCGWRDVRVACIGRLRSCSRLPTNGRERFYPQKLDMAGLSALQPRRRGSVATAPTAASRCAGRRQRERLQAREFCRGLRTSAPLAASSSHDCVWCICPDEGMVAAGVLAVAPGTCGLECPRSFSLGFLRFFPMIPSQVLVRTNPAICFLDRRQGRAATALPLSGAGVWAPQKGFRNIRRCGNGKRA